MKKNMKISAIAAAAAMLVMGCGSGDTPTEEVSAPKLGEDIGFVMYEDDEEVSNVTKRLYGVTQQGELTTDAANKELLDGAQTLVPVAGDTEIVAPEKLQTFLQQLFEMYAAVHGVTRPTQIWEEIKDQDVSLAEVYLDFERSGLSMSEYVAMYVALDEAGVVGTQGLQEWELMHWLQEAQITPRQLMDTLHMQNSSLPAFFQAVARQGDDLRTVHAKWDQRAPEQATLAAFVQAYLADVPAPVTRLAAAVLTTGGGLQKGDETTDGSGGATPKPDDTPKPEDSGGVTPPTPKPDGGATPVDPVKPSDVKPVPVPDASDSHAEPVDPVAPSDVKPTPVPDAADKPMDAATMNAYVEAAKVGLKIVKFVWEVIKENRPVVEVNDFHTSVLSVNDDNYTNYSNAKMGESKKVKYVVCTTTFGKCIKDWAVVETQLAGTYGAQNAKHKGHWMPAISVETPKVWAAFGQHVNVSASISSFSNLGDTNNIIPYARVNVRIDVGGVFTADSATKIFTVHGKDGFAAKK